jgi:hypothetical protein
MHCTGVIAPFRQLTLAIWDRFPETPPMVASGQTSSLRISVAWLLDERQLDQVTDDFIETARGRLPIRAIASEVALMDNSSGVQAMFGLGQKQ